jgi:hypothetical protein
MIDGCQMVNIMQLVTIGNYGNAVHLGQPAVPSPHCTIAGSKGQTSSIGQHIHQIL